MEQLLYALSHALRGAPVLACAAALVWGVLSLLLSPCHLASIPLVVGFVSEQGQITKRRAGGISLLFALGMLITIGVIGAVTAASGRILGDVGRWTSYAVALMLLVVGLHLLDALSLPAGFPQLIGSRRRGPMAAMLLGMVFGVALGPCTFAFMAPVLAVTFALSGTNLPYALGLLLIYAIGHCSVVVLAGTFADVAQRYLDWSDRSGGGVGLKRACGALVVLGGVYMIYTAP